VIDQKILINFRFYLKKISFHRDCIIIIIKFVMFKEYKNKLKSIIILNHYAIIFLLLNLMFVDYINDTQVLIKKSLYYIIFVLINTNHINKF